MSESIDQLRQSFERIRKERDQLKAQLEEQLEEAIKTGVCETCKKGHILLYDSIRAHFDEFSELKQNEFEDLVYDSKCELKKETK